MALHDQDKENGDRANPKLNADDNVANRMAHRTIGTTYKTTGNPDTNRLIFDKGSIKGYDQDNNNNVFIGYDPALSTRPIVRIAKDGFDQETASNDQLIFNSDQNVFKIVLTSTVTLNANAAAGVPITVTIPHNLGYTPASLVYFNSQVGLLTQLPNSTGFGLAAGQIAINNWSYAQTDATNLYITFLSGSTANWGSFTYKYYLLQEAAN